MAEILLSPHDVAAAILLHTMRPGSGLLFPARATRSMAAPGRHHADYDGWDRPQQRAGIDNNNGILCVRAKSWSVCESIQSSPTHSSTHHQPFPQPQIWSNQKLNATRSTHTARTLPPPPLLTMNTTQIYSVRTSLRIASRCFVLRKSFWALQVLGLFLFLVLQTPINWSEYKLDELVILFVN